MNRQCCFEAGGQPTGRRHRRLPPATAALHPRKPVRLTTVPMPALWGRAWLLAAKPTESTARHEANWSSIALALISGSQGG